MPSPEQMRILKAYTRRVREALRAHPANTEPGLAPEFHRMLVDLPDFIPQLRDVAGRITELLFLFDEADAILARTLDDSLTREALGLGRQEDDGENGGRD